MRLPPKNKFEPNRSGCWGDERPFDASVQDTYYPGPGTPLSQLKAGTRLRVLWDSYGKAHLAFFVVRPHWQTGWALYGQRGLDGR